MSRVNPTILSVKALVGSIRRNLEGDFSGVHVQGEIVGLTRAASGHIYLTLKDSSAQIRAMIFKTNARFLKFQPMDGMEIVARGKISVYEPRGEMQFVVDSMEPVGDGALALAFEKLKKELAQKGWFASERKQDIPEFPSCVGIVTSLSAAALYDALRILLARQPGLHIIVSPTPVQGAQAPPQIVAALNNLDESGLCDVIIIVRGGGSPEDLWAFNDPVVVEAVVNCNTPAISGVGHEIDVTLCDLAADVRAATPTAAAQAATFDHRRLDVELLASTRRLAWAVSRIIETRQQGLDEMRFDFVQSAVRQVSSRNLEFLNLRDRLFRSQPLLGLKQRRESLRDNNKRLIHSIRRFVKSKNDSLALMTQRAPGSATRKIAEHGRRLELFARQLDNLSPLAVLGRGYAIARDAETGKVARRARDHPLNSRLELILREGSLAVSVIKGK